jgi:hypothetical protein
VTGGLVRERTSESSGLGSITGAGGMVTVEPFIQKSTFVEDISVAK